MDIQFESFADLVHRLGHPPKNACEPAADGAGQATPPDEIFASWLNHLPRPFPPHTGKCLFRLLFPHEGNRRRYGMKETRLSSELESILGVRNLRQWDSVAWDRGRGGTGCLGDEVEFAMATRLPAETRSSLTIHQMDSLLDELAAPSPFSQLSLVPAQYRPAQQILQQLYRDGGLSAFAMSVLTQILLRDLRPLLCPLPQLPLRNPTAMLRVTAASAPEQLSMNAAMRRWDINMARLYHDGKGNLDWCADAAETLSRSGHQHVTTLRGPIVGVTVPIPKCRKGRSVHDALKPFYRNGDPLCATVWAETKYDGYRMQIHVSRVGNAEWDVTIFSKSKRQSTVERGNSHAIVFAALGLRIPDHCARHRALGPRASGAAPRQTLLSSIILEAEVIPYNEGEREGRGGPGVEEFWWLGRAGVDATEVSASDTGQRHLCLAFFDVLHLDGENLLGLPYEKRRGVLEKHIAPIRGFSMLAERTAIPIGVGHVGMAEAERALRAVFHASNDRREEGLVLKACSSMYNEARLPWVKYKKDYIPNLGDCVDLVVLGAGWDVDRARELRVDTSVYTSFYIGTLTNREAACSRREAPHFTVLFRVSYGMSRSQLERYNDAIRLGAWGTKSYDRDDKWKRRLIGLSWKFDMPPSLVPPSVLFEQPLCAEIMGAGFQRLPWRSPFRQPLYELRWPRLVKIYDKVERPWTDALGDAELRRTAHEALGYAVAAEATRPASPSQEADSVHALWRSKSTLNVVDIPDLSPSPTSSVCAPRAPQTPGRFASAPAPLVLKSSPCTPPAKRLCLPRLSPRTPKTSPHTPLKPRRLFADALPPWTVLALGHVLTSDPPDAPGTSGPPSPPSGGEDLPFLSTPVGRAPKRRRTESRPKITNTATDTDAPAGLRTLSMLSSTMLHARDCRSEPRRLHTPRTSSLDLWGSPRLDPPRSHTPRPLSLRSRLLLAQRRAARSPVRAG